MMKFHFDFINIFINKIMIKSVKTSQEVVDYINNAPIGVLYIYSDSCGYCQQMTPQINSLSRRYSNIPFTKSLVENDIVDVNGVPFTMLLDKNGKTIDTVSGADIKKLERYLMTNIRKLNYS